MATHARPSSAQPTGARPRTRATTPAKPRSKVRWASVLGATTTGVLIAATGGSYVAALVLSGAFALLGAISYLVIVGRVEPLPPRP